jgi:spore coat protein U-like protein
VTHHARWLLQCLLWMVLGSPGAQAQNCVLNIGNISFGTINAAAGADSTANLVFDCNVSDPRPLLRVCISIGAPGTGDVQNRKLPGPQSALLSYNLYRDAARTQIWGSINGTLPPPALDYPISGGKVHAAIPLYGRVPGGQSGLPGGDYRVTYAVADIQVGIRSYLVTPSDCSNIPVDSTISQSRLYVNATLSSACSVSATPIDFGQKGTLGTDSSATGTVTANCGSGVAYSLSMNAGTGAGATPANRLLTRSGGSETIRYGLFTNPTFTSIWGDGSAGSTTVSATGSGANQSYTVHARMPAQTPTPRPGTYRDTITLTITY